MAIKFKVGAVVRQVMPAPIEGTVTEAQVSDDEVIYHVESIDAEGNRTARFFSEAQIEAVDAPAGE